MSRSPLRGTAALALGAVAAAVVVAPSPAEARTFDKAKVIRVMDGDTIDVDRNHDGRIDARIRLLGIDAPEHGLCHFQASKRALKRLVRHKVVTLRSKKGRTGIMHRLERRVIVPSHGQMIDAATWMLERGWGVWMPRAGETDHSLRQHKAADRAAAGSKGWFSVNHCGAGPYADDSLHMEVEYQSDAASWMSSTAVRNQEFIRIRNTGTEPANIDGWTLRVGNDRKRSVPAGGPIPPGEAVDIHVGFGTNTVSDRYLGSSVPMLVNAELDGSKNLGSGSYLIDPNNDIRAYTTWPCTLNCADPTQGALVLSNVVYDPDGPDSENVNGEYLQITNRGSVPIRTGAFVIEVQSYRYELPANHVLNPGETLTLHSGRGNDTRLDRYLGGVNAAMVNDGDRVLIRTYDAIVVDCFAWGSGHCPHS